MTTAVEGTSASKGVLFTSFVRTYVPYLAGGALGHVIAVVLAWLGLPTSDSTVQRIFEGAFFGIYYVISRYLETHKDAKWGWLLGQAKAPAYSPEPAPSPDAPNETLVAQPVDEPGGGLSLDEHDLRMAELERALEAANREIDALRAELARVNGELAAERDTARAPRKRATSQRVQPAPKVDTPAKVPAKKVTTKSPPRKAVP